MVSAPMTKVKPLDYTWAATRRPVGGEATFAINGNNEAKRNRRSPITRPVHTLYRHHSRCCRIIHYQLPTGERDPNADRSSVHVWGRWDTPITTSQSVSTASHTVKTARRGSIWKHNDDVARNHVVRAKAVQRVALQQRVGQRKRNHHLHPSRQLRHSAKNGNVQADVQFNVAQTQTSIGVKKRRTKPSLRRRHRRLSISPNDGPPQALDQFGIAMTSTTPN